MWLGAVPERRRRLFLWSRVAKCHSPKTPLGTDVIDGSESINYQSRTTILMLGSVFPTNCPNREISMSRPSLDNNVKWAFEKFCFELLPLIMEINLGSLYQLPSSDIIPDILNQ